MFILLNGVSVLVQRFQKDESGDILQYVLIIALLVVFFLPKITDLQTAINGVFSNLTTQLSTL